MRRAGSSRPPWWSSVTPLRWRSSCPALDWPKADARQRLDWLRTSPSRTSANLEV